MSRDSTANYSGLQHYVSAALAAWPDFAVDEARFANYVIALHPEGTLPPTRHAADLLLACACADGHTKAVRVFHRVYIPIIARVLARRRAPAHLADDAEQLVVQRLLVGSPDAAAKIREYRGAGALRSWVAAAAATQLLMMLRASTRRHESPLDGAEPLIAGLRDPELAHLAERYKTQVQEAVVHAIARLTERERVLLRLQLADRLSVDQLGRMYGVDRATAARWLARARASLLQHARADLRARMKLTETECDSILNLVRSEIHVSVLRHLHS